MSETATIAQALARHLAEPGPGGCRVWSGNIRSGYGRVSVKGNLLYVHRAVWMVERGPVPSGLTVDHECHNADPTCPGGVTCQHRACGEISHLSLKTAVENSRAASLIERTGKCGVGHPVSGINVYIVRGKPICRTCHLARQRKYDNIKKVAQQG